VRTLTIARPDDWHLHLRDGAALADVVPYTARVFGRAVVMPNLVPPVSTTERAVAYRERILAACSPGLGFNPLMTLYLTDQTTPEEVRLAAASGVVHGVKLYPAGATTHSDAGVRDLERLEATLEAMAEVGLPLLVHGEVTDRAVDVFDRERVFLERVAQPLVDRHRELKLVVEHATTAEAVQFVRGAREGVAATLTPQHLLMDRNALFEGGLQPHHYCLPVLKRSHHRTALLEAATSGSPRFFLGTDSAPHGKHAKEAPCGCAGCFTAPHALPLYAMAFDEAGALHRLEGFASRFGPAFYGLPVSDQQVSLIEEAWTVPATLPFAGGAIVPLWAGRTLPWRVVEAGP
jgi:dihydroorotase